MYLIGSAIYNNSKQHKNSFSLHFLMRLLYLLHVLHFLLRRGECAVLKNLTTYIFIKQLHLMLIRFILILIMRKEVGWYV